MQAIGKARRQIIWNENLLEPREITNDEAIFPNATSVGESMPHSEPDSSHGIVLNIATLDSKFFHSLWI